MRLRSTIIDWIPISDNEKPEDFEQVFITAEGYDEVMIGERLHNDWFLVNTLGAKAKKEIIKLNVIAWAYRPEIYKR